MTVLYTVAIVVVVGRLVGFLWTTVDEWLGYNPVEERKRLKKSNEIVAGGVMASPIARMPIVGYWCFSCKAYTSGTPLRCEDCDGSRQPGHSDRPVGPCCICGRRICIRFRNGKFFCTEHWKAYVEPDTYKRGDRVVVRVDAVGCDSEKT